MNTKTITLEAIKTFNDEQLTAVDALCDAIEETAKARGLRNEEYAEWVSDMLKPLFGSDVTECQKFLVAWKSEKNNPEAVYVG